MSLLDDIKKHEGFSNIPYKCTEGYLTIGYGKRVDYIKVDEKTAEKWLIQDIEDLQKRIASTFGWFFNSPEDVKDVVTNMCYQLGIKGFSCFKKSIYLLETEQYQEASIEVLDSLWARQTPNRAKELSEILSHVQR